MSMITETITLPQYLPQVLASLLRKQTFTCDENTFSSGHQRPTWTYYPPRQCMLPSYLSRLSHMVLTTFPPIFNSTASTMPNYRPKPHHPLQNCICAPS